MNIQSNKDLTYLTTMKTKCVAEYFVEVESEAELLEAIKYATDHDLKLLMLGGGSNTIILKDRVEGLVVKNRYVKKEIVRTAVAFVDVKVSSGYVVARFVSEMVAAGYEGVEYHLGLPGSVGGALYMNSKWTRPESYFGDSLIFATIADRNGVVRRVDHDYFHFAYD
ncbi:FAD-binding protein, partial [Candidatus Microgenomates bacterium]|nr:FAD-binding protein [Candidatus Microgenomates bacterium]